MSKSKENGQPENLTQLLESCGTARNFFTSLPDYVRGGVCLKADSIQSEEDLHRCADSISESLY